MKTFLALVFFAFTSALLSASLRAADAATPAKAPDFSAAQQYLQVVEWGAKGGERFTLADNAVLIETADPAAAAVDDPFATGKTQNFKLDAAAAAEAWEKIGKLGIMKWRGAYDSRDLGQEDGGGTEWTVEYRSGQEKKKSLGVNAFPGLQPLGMPQLGSSGVGADPETAYSNLVSILHSLKAKAD